MSRRNSTAWRWHRFIARDDEALWTERLGADGGLNWMVIEKPGRVRLLVEAYFPAKTPALALSRKWGGRAEPFWPKPPKPAAPVRVSADLEIVHDEKAPRSATRLIIPYGTAFGSGEHATTLMLLRALARRGDLAKATVLDLGTGSGVLAIGVRKLRNIPVLATDIDPIAVRVARENVRRNGIASGIALETAPGFHSTAFSRHGPFDLIIANILARPLIKMAPQLVAHLAPGGSVILSGILAEQRWKVLAAYNGAKLRHVRTIWRNGWVTIHLDRP